MRYSEGAAGGRTLARVSNASARRLSPWGSYTNALIFLRPRPPSIQLTPQFCIGVFRKSCPPAESDGIVPQSRPHLHPAAVWHSGLEQVIVCVSIAQTVVVLVSRRSIASTLSMSVAKSLHPPSRA
jgi:hypothetical protein